MKNMKIRELAEQNGVKLWEIAEQLGILDCNFSRKLRRELDESEQEHICRIIAEIAAGRAS